MNIYTFPFVKALAGLVLMSMLVVSGCYMPLGRSEENPSWFSQIALATLGTPTSRYILPEMRELCTQYGAPVDNGFAVGGYAYSPFQFEKTIGKFKASSEMTATVRVGCFPCIQELLIDGYPYIEAFYVSSRDLQHLEKISRFQGRSKVRWQDGFTTETGWYRYYLVDRKTKPDLCRQYDFIVAPVSYDSTRSFAEEQALRKAKGLRKTIEPWLQEKLGVQEKCVAIEKIVAPTSRYLVENFGVVQQKVGGLVGEGLILREASIITDRSDGKILASQNNFSYRHSVYHPAQKPNSRRFYRYVSSCGAPVGFLNTRMIVRP